MSIPIGWNASCFILPPYWKHESEGGQSDSFFWNLWLQCGSTVAGLHHLRHKEGNCHSCCDLSFSCSPKNLVKVSTMNSITKHFLSNISTSLVLSVSWILNWCNFLGWNTQRWTSTTSNFSCLLLCRLKASTSVIFVFFVFWIIFLCLLEMSLLFWFDDFGKGYQVGDQICS